MSKSTAEAYMELLSIIGIAIFAILAGMQVIKPMGFIVGCVVVGMSLAAALIELDKIDEGP